MKLANKFFRKLPARNLNFQKRVEIIASRSAVSIFATLLLMAKLPRPSCHSLLNRETNELPSQEVVGLYNSNGGYRVHWKFRLLQIETHT